ncbi:hypothetical protein BDR26DRAFT_871831 [Obelidium mucronatum]|nr:hypothetical protein BDR26DRAFT_871831 [Obelidium mucronatum]
MSTVFILGVSTATFLYWSTYVYVAERLRHATGVSHTEEIARKVLIRCILMSSGMLVCYLPRMIVQLTVNSQTYYDSFTTSIANVFASFDVVLTPALILYFRPDVRIKIVNAFASNNNQRTDEEQPHPAASSTQTIVDIHERK